MDNIFQLYHELKTLTYKHGNYQQFKINDPKSRTIHKASVRDRLLHHAVYRILCPFFDKKFISDSFSCRNNKGTHKALKRIERFVRKVPQNNTMQCYILKCDIKKFFASIDQNILPKILQKHISVRLSRDNQNKTIDLLKEIIVSFKPNGLPLGNLTSQLFANVYLNELDQFINHKLKAKHYIRYADDFVILSQDKNCLKNLIPQVQKFLQNELKLTLHPNKIFTKRLKLGMDFLGWINFFGYRVLRGKIIKRIFKRILENPKKETVASYLGLIKHGKTSKIKKEVIRIYEISLTPHRDEALDF